MASLIEDHFDRDLSPVWQASEAGQGSVRANGGLRLTVRPTTDRQYSNAQIADYDYRDFRFAWQPPLRLTVTARASAPTGDLRGTAGFGFWNHPFSPDTRRLRLPQAIWFFFGSPPNDMRLADGVPGRGWKAATIDAGRPAALALAPLALPALVLMQLPALYRRLYPPIQRALGIHERLLDGSLLADTRTYTIDWRKGSARFAVDGETALETPSAPRGRAGFIAWMDNQYAVVTPQGRMRFGVVAVEREQWLQVEYVKIESD